MNNKQLVTEKTPYVTAILLAEAKDYLIPRFIHQKAIIYLNAKFRIHNGIPTFFFAIGLLSVCVEDYQCLAKPTFGRVDICLRSTTELQILENKNE